MQMVFVRPLRLGLLFQAESVGASLEAPDTPCPLQPRKSQIVGGSFMGKQSNGQGSWAATSAARTDFAFTLFLCG